jgi:hypothetical protein
LQIQASPQARETGNPNFQALDHMKSSMNLVKHSHDSFCTTYRKNGQNPVADDDATMLIAKAYSQLQSA